jgi:ribosomal protein S18 acetylase RimI-like enzyme
LLAGWRRVRADRHPYWRRRPAPVLLDQVVETYASGAVASGELTRGHAHARARADLQALLPAGTRTTSTLLASLRIGDERIGDIWLGLRGPTAHPYGWIWHVYVEPGHRGHGYTAQATAGRSARPAGVRVSEVRLNVFTSNAAATGLYRRLGYAATSQVMSRHLGRG